jgi:hypothetical protein
MVGIVLITSLFLPLISAVPPLTTEFTGDVGFDIEANVMNYYKINEGACVHIYVFNKTDGVIMDNTTVSCTVELTNHNGTVMLSGTPPGEDNHFHMCRNQYIVNDSEVYGLTIVCNDSSKGGYKTHFFEANVLGEGLTEEIASSHNYSIIFLMALFSFALIGLVKTENLALKFGLYWVCHVLFVVGTFAIWQFNEGFALNFIATAEIFKVLFYVSISAMLPMMILSIAWMIVITATSKEITRLIDKGYTPIDAEKRAGRKKK